MIALHDAEDYFFSDLKNIDIAFIMPATPNPIIAKITYTMPAVCTASITVISASFLKFSNNFILYPLLSSGCIQTIDKKNIHKKSVMIIYINPYILYIMYWNK